MPSNRKGPVVADSVTIRSPRGVERVVSKAAVPFFTNQDWVVLTADGRVNTKATTAAASSTDKKD